MSEIQIPVNVFKQIVTHAKNEASIEVCGILAGKNSKVEKLYKMRNIDNSADHFMMDPEDQFKVVKDIRHMGLQMLAIYHSHPYTPARPSAEDIRLALTPGVVYVIISFVNDSKPNIRGFIIEDRNVSEVPIKIGGE